MSDSNVPVPTAINTLVRYKKDPNYRGRVWNYSPGIEYPVYVMFNSAMGFGECYTEAEFQEQFERVPDNG